MWKIFMKEQKLSVLNSTCALNTTNRILYAVVIHTLKELISFTWHVSFWQMIWQSRCKVIKYRYLLRDPHTKLWFLIVIMSVLCALVCFCQPILFLRRYWMTAKCFVERKKVIGCLSQKRLKNTKPTLHKNSEWIYASADILQSEVMN